MPDTASGSARTTSSKVTLLSDAAAREKRRKKRDFKDKLSRWGVTAAGFGVVFALTLIFAYLFYEVMPIFKGASVKSQISYPLPSAEHDLLHLSIERYQELAIQIDRQAQARFFDLETGTLKNQLAINLPEQVTISSFAAAEPISQLFGFGLDNGQVVIAKYGFDIDFPNDQRQLLPKIDYPVGQKAFTIDPQGQALNHLAIERSARGGMVIAATTKDNRLLVNRLSTQTDLQTGDIDVSLLPLPVIKLDFTPFKVLVDKMQRSVFIADKQGQLHYYDISGNTVDWRQTITLADQQRITALTFLVGSVSLIVGTDKGQLSQWFLVRDEHNQEHLTQIRIFKPHHAAITAIAPEYTRKGFHVVDADGQLGIHYGTSARTLSLKKQSDSPLTHIAVSQVNGRLLWLDEHSQLTMATLWNEHPQLSFSGLWNRVWYEGRSEPTYIWQSSSASDEFESKFSLVPLSIGTLKAAFYAMLFAMPLAIAGAIYTAYFMSPKIRGYVKPSIEIMEALPTVILGFLAGLWLAPFTEDHLPAIFSFLLLMPVMLLVFAYGWSRLPYRLRGYIPDGWEAALLVPVIILFGYVCISLSPYIEIWFFDGSMRQWLTDIGITYDQRNAMIVGIAMGFAVIPTIFSIAEDAVFTVPKHLSQGALALGATRWQTMLWVVLPTASPGIFSAVMMGFGRAVGETMIVLMATGNSPVVNFNIFEGMRTLSANIAVELPETAVGSSHFRILFLAALVLLALTFILNTLAEVIRQRLRARYSNL